MPHFVNYNGKFLHEDMPIVGAGNRGLRYGDGIFETMKVIDTQILLETYHFERLFGALDLLRFQTPVNFTPAFLKEQILALCLKNNLKQAARIRLNVFRKNGGLYDPIDCSPDFVIEAWELPENYFRLNENGLIVDIYEEARKSCDRFSSIKSNNYLLYAMGAFYAKENKLNDCLILNSDDRICDATIANIFWVHDRHIFTPPLTEGSVAGVMRRHVLDILPQKGFTIREKNFELSDLHAADELFLTNAISGIRWIKEACGKHFTNNLTKNIYAILY